MAESPEEVGYQRRKSKRYTVPTSSVQSNRQQCKFCPATIVWTKTPPTPYKRDGGNMPLDLATSREESPGVLSMEPHWGRCPGSDVARRPRR